MPTLLQLISDGLGDIGVLKPGQTPSGTQAQVTIRKFNDMVLSWSAFRLRLFFVPEVQYTMANGVGSYQIGPGLAPPNFDTTAGGYVRPVFVQAASVQVGTARRWPLNLLTRPQWLNNQSRSLTDPDGPLDIFYDSNTPVATINVAPKPNSAQMLFMDQWNPLHTFAPGDLAVNVEDFYPLHYLKPLRLSLGAELASSYRVPISQEMAKGLSDSLAYLEGMNNDLLSGAFGVSRTLDAPTKGDGSPVQQG